MGKRKRCTAEEKIRILREILEDGQSVSMADDKHSIHPTNIFNWKKQLFESGVQLIESKRPDISLKAEGGEIAALEEKLRQKDEVIAELAEENLGLKKKSSGL
jgi:transposase-like protein